MINSWLLIHVGWLIEILGLIVRCSEKSGDSEELRKWDEMWECFKQFRGKFWASEMEKYG